MPKQPLLELIRYQLEQFVTQPTSEPAVHPPAEVMARFPVPVQRLMQPGT
jgi:hypothetical protein